MPLQKPLTSHLDFRSKFSIYIQIINLIEQQVSAGTLKLDAQLPTVLALASELRFHFNNLAKAYRPLDDLGVSSTQQGRGTYILVKPPAEVEKKTRATSPENRKRGAKRKNTLVSGFLTQEIAP